MNQIKPKTIEELDSLINEQFKKQQLNFDPERGFYDDCYFGIVESIWDLFFKEEEKVEKEVFCPSCKNPVYIHLPEDHKYYCPHCSISFIFDNSK